MNKKFLEFARTEIKTGLSQCTNKQKDIFRRMYANGNMSLPIDDIVDNMPEDRLDWAMQQIERTLSKRS